MHPASFVAACIQWSEIAAGKHGCQSLAGLPGSCTCLQDAVQGGHIDPSTLGKLIVLPSSFLGGDRHMQQQYQDAMAVVRAKGSPDIFTTFTCNPKWPEIAAELLPGQDAKDRPDLTARVFKLKLTEYLADIRKRHSFGRPIAYLQVTEFQKRGLPHAYIVTILPGADKPRTPDEVDRIVSAEIPDPVTEPKAYASVIKHMMHGPCGPSHPNAPCMVVGKDGQRRCSKGYPKDFQESTTMANGGQPVYRRCAPDTPWQGLSIYRCCLQCVCSSDLSAADPYC